MALLSIIVPVYNKEKYIDECLQSILSQSFTDFELILVNDGSTDASFEKCRKYQQSDDRIVLINQQNQGVSAARNVGISKAGGTFIGFIDSDDTIDHDMYETLVNNALATSADIAVCRLRVLFPNKVVAPHESDEIVTLNYQQGLSACLAGELDRSANNKIYKRSIVSHIKFEGQIYEDILYTCKAFLNAKTTVFINQVKYNYLIRDNSVSMSSFNKKYLQTTDVSQQMVKLVQAKAPDCLPEAQAFDVITNISLLNLLLLSNIGEYQIQYQQVANTLHSYKGFINHSAILSRKYKVSYKLFAVSPRLYKSLMYLYGLITGAEVIKRTKKQQAGTN